MFHAKTTEEITAWIGTKILEGTYVRNGLQPILRESRRRIRRRFWSWHKAELDSSGTAGQGVLKVEFKFQERGQPQTGFNSLHVAVPVALPILDLSGPLNEARVLVLTLLTAASQHIQSVISR